MAFAAGDYQGMQQRFHAALAQPITLLVNNGAGFDRHVSHGIVKGHSEHDLVAGGIIQQGDLKVIISQNDVPAGLAKLEKKDRIEIGGKAYGVIHWDDHTRTVADNLVAVEVTIRG